MAIWQFELEPVRTSSAMIDGVPAIHLGPEHRAEASLGLTPEARADLTAALDDILPRQDAWSRGMMLWGSTRGSDVQLFLDDDGTQNLKIRLDAKTFTTALIDALCLLALTYDWVFLTDQGAVLQPNTASVLRALLNSPARRYVENPDAVLAAAARPLGSPA